MLECSNYTGFGTLYHGSDELAIAVAQWVNGMSVQSRPVVVVAVGMAVGVARPSICTRIMQRS